MGAVMGSKNLKAIVVGGQGSGPKPRPEKLEDLTRHFRRIITPSPMATAEHGPPHHVRRAGRRLATAAWATA